MLFRRRVNPVKDLAGFQADRETSPPEPNTESKNAWGWFRQNPDDLKRLGLLVKHATALKNLKDSPDWQEILSIRAFMQETSTQIARNPNTDDKRRFQASVEWATLEVFFKEIELRVRRGREAEDKLRELTPKK